MSSLEYHVMLSMATGPKYGYAIKDAVAAESVGTLQPRAGTLYRVLARLMTQEWVTEVQPDDDSPHPGLTRRYYGLTARGRSALAQEANRLRGAAALAEERLGLAKERG